MVQEHVQQTAEAFNHRISYRNGSATEGAAPSQSEVAEQRDVVPWAQLLLAGGAMRGGEYERLPPRQPVNADVGKTTDYAAEYKCDGVTGCEPLNHATSMSNASCGLLPGAKKMQKGV